MSNNNNKKQNPNRTVYSFLYNNFERLILLYTIIFTLTNLFAYTNIPWLYVGLPFWVFVFGPAVYSFLIMRVLNK
jgi:hypothetical protein